MSLLLSAGVCSDLQFIHSCTLPIQRLKVMSVLGDAAIIRSHMESCLTLCSRSTVRPRSRTSMLTVAFTECELKVRAGDPNPPTSWESLGEGNERVTPRAALMNAIKIP